MARKYSFTVSLPAEVVSIIEGVIERKEAASRSDAVAVLCTYAQQILDLKAQAEREKALSGS